MSKYWSASTNSIWCSNVCAVNQMPEDVVLLTDAEFTELMEKQAQGYRIVHNSSTGKPQAIEQTCGTCTCISCVQTVNGNAPDSDGNITPEQTGCLPLTGGTMTGLITTTSSAAVRRSGSDGFLQFSMETVLNGGRLNLYGKDYSNASTAGGFELLTGDGTDAIKLLGTVAGSLTWDGVEIVRSNYTEKGSGNHCVRFSNGLQICWGVTGNVQNSTHTFLKAFISAPTVIAAVDSNSPSTDTRYCTVVTSTTQIKVYKTTTNGGYWVAIGWWK